MYHPKSSTNLFIVCGEPKATSLKNCSVVLPFLAISSPLAITYWLATFRRGKTSAILLIPLASRIFKASGSFLMYAFATISLKSPFGKAPSSHSFPVFLIMRDWILTLLNSSAAFSSICLANKSPLLADISKCFINSLSLVISPVRIPSSISFICSESWGLNGTSLPAALSANAFSCASFASSRIFPNFSFCLFWSLLPWKSQWIIESHNLLYQGVLGSSFLLVISSYILFKAFSILASLEWYLPVSLS